MTGLAGAEGIRAGDQVIVDGRPRVVLGASGTAVRFAGDDGVVEEAALAELAGRGRLARGPRVGGGHQWGGDGVAGAPPSAGRRARGGGTAQLMGGRTGKGWGGGGEDGGDP